MSTQDNHSLTTLVETLYALHDRDRQATCILELQEIDKDKNKSPISLGDNIR